MDSYIPNNNSDFGLGHQFFSLGVLFSFRNVPTASSPELLLAVRSNLVRKCTTTLVVMKKTAFFSSRGTMSRFAQLIKRKLKFLWILRTSGNAQFAIVLWRAAKNRCFLNAVPKRYFIVF